MSLKILHCADFHLDTVFSFLNHSAAECRREDLRTAFGKAVALTEERDADMLIISGDLFDSADVSLATARYVRSKLAEIKDKDIYICAGNHDPKTASSYLSILDFGENVHVFGTSIEWIEKEEYDIYGISFKESLVHDSFLSGFKVKNPDKINIMVMHGDFTTSDYNLITKAQMEQSGIDYLALGHIHKHEIIRGGGCTAVYPGCPEGRGFDETGQKGVVFSEVEKGRTETEFIPICRRKLHELKVSVTGLISYEEIAAKISEQIESENDLYKIELSGEAEFDINISVIMDKLNVFFSKIYDRTEPKRDWEREADEFTLRGLFIKKALTEMEKNEDDEIAQLAFKIGLSAMEGR